MANKKNSRSNKKSKDSKSRKRHRSAYILFSNEKRHQVKTDNPGLSSKEILSELGALWKTADNQTKQHFQKLSDAEKAEYAQRFNHFKNKKTNQSNEQNQSMEVNSSQ